MGGIFLRWVRSIKNTIPFISSPSPPNTADLFESSAQQAHHLCVYLRAGLPAQKITQYLDNSSSAHVETQNFLVNVWKKAQQTGISPADFYHNLALICEEVADVVRWAQAVESGPRAASTLIMALPVIALAGASLMGNGAIGFLLTEPAGWFLVVMAASLMWVARGWSKRLVDKATTISWHTGMYADFCAMFLRAGYPPHTSALEARAVIRLIPSQHSVPQEEKEVQETLNFARTEGIPAAGLLESLARSQRSKQRQRVRSDIESLSVKLIVPLGACVLPAFIAVGVIPVVVSMFSSTTFS